MVFRGKHGMDRFVDWRHMGNHSLGRPANFYYDVDDQLLRLKGIICLVLWAACHLGYYSMYESFPNGTREYM